MVGLSVQVACGVFQVSGLSTHQCFARLICHGHAPCRRGWGHAFPVWLLRAGVSGSELERADSRHGDHGVLHLHGIWWDRPSASQVEDEVPQFSGKHFLLVGLNYSQSGLVWLGKHLFLTLSYAISVWQGDCAFVLIFWIWDLISIHKCTCSFLLILEIIKKMIL